MCSVIRVMIVAVMVIATLLSGGAAYTLDASYYTKYVPSTCYGMEDQGTMVAAAHEIVYRNGTACGWKYNVRCIKEYHRNTCRGDGYVTVKIVGLCPSPNCSAALTLSKEAFSKIAYPAAGTIQIDLTVAGDFA